MSATFTTFRRLLAARRAVTSIEFAIVGTAMLLLTFAIIEVGLILWTQDVLSSTALIAARCGAINGAQCSSGVANYAVTEANNWLVSGAISTSNVTASSVSTCGTVSGHFQSVQISTSAFNSSSLPPPFNAQTITVSACYPCASC